MITSQQLLERLKIRERKIKFEALAQILFDERFPLIELIDFTFHTDNEIGFHAAWLLEMVFLTSPDVYLEDIPYLIQRLPDVKNNSCRRHFARMLMYITDKKASSAVIDKVFDQDLEPIIEALFDWLIDRKVKIAVKVFSADALHQLSGRYPWIKDELGEQVKFLMRDGTAAIQQRGKKLLHQMQKEKHLQTD